MTNTVDALVVSNQEIVVTEPGATGLTDGSIFDTLNVGHGFETGAAVRRVHRSRGFDCRRLRFVAQSG